ncbi:MAG TPA: hypothetical protein VGQ45_09325 [Gaiellales bacterium]|jgi:hypothetical protein|nr:hypothetical protein [Gaiellales bacterium]
MPPAGEQGFESLQPLQPLRLTEVSAERITKKSRSTCTPDVAVELSEIWWQTDIRAVLPVVPVPTLLMVEDASSFPAITEYVASLIPHAQVEVVPDPGWSFDRTQLERGYRPFQAAANLSSRSARQLRWGRSASREGGRCRPQVACRPHQTRAIPQGHLAEPRRAVVSRSSRAVWAANMTPVCGSLAIGLPSGLNIRRLRGGDMYARVATFQSDPANIDGAIEMVRSEVDSNETPPGLQGAKMLMLVDRATGKGLGITLFADEQAMQRGDEALNAMNPGAGERRTSVEFYEVPVHTVN